MVKSGPISLYRFPKDIEENDRIIEAYRDRFKRLRFMIENSFSVGDIMELLVAVE